MAQDQQERKLPPPFDNSNESFTLITQGAEALLYKTTFLSPSNPTALKVRPAKPWRHPTLDRRLTRQRITAESRVLVKCLKEGVSVPGILALDLQAGWVMSEWIEGRTVKQAIRERDLADKQWAARLMREIGRSVGRLHSVGIIHGDLTTSNMMLREGTSDEEHGRNKENEGGGQGKKGEEEEEAGVEGEIVLIDFGLATQGVQDEDRAVDLYVLERAFGSTHPKEEDLFQEVLNAYATTYKAAKITLKRLEDVRMRGRKKSMIG